MTINYKPHQERVANKLKTQRGLIAYHGLGSGKTLTSIRSAEKFFGKNIVVVTPASLRDNFKKELLKAKAKKNYEIYSYEEFSNKKPSLKNKMLILDEAHRIRSSQSQRSQIIREKAKEAVKILMLTGTPIQNKPHEIAPLINTLTNKNTLPLSQSDFESRYLQKNKVQPGFFDRVFRGASTTTTVSAKNLKDFKSKVKKYVDHHGSAKNTSDFPEVETSFTDVEMSPSQAATYRGLAGKASLAARYAIQNRLPVSKKELKELNAFIGAARQISNTEKAYDAYHSGDTSPKVKRIASTLAKAKGPSIVYSNYLDSGLNEVSKELKKKKLKHALYTGSLRDKEKKQIVEEYNKGKLKALLVSSSGAEGLDLKKTRQVHIMEPHWNDPKIEQVIGRAARFKSHEGLPKKEQKVNVFRYRSVIPKKKQNIIKKIFGLKNTPETSADEYLTEMSEKKLNLNRQFLSQLQ